MIFSNDIWIIISDFIGIIKLEYVCKSLSELLNLRYIHIVINSTFIQKFHNLLIACIEKIYKMKNFCIFQLSIIIDNIKYDNKCYILYYISLFSKLYIEQVYFTMTHSSLINNTDCSYMFEKLLFYTYTKKISLNLRNTLMKKHIDCNYIGKLFDNLLLLNEFDFEIINNRIGDECLSKLLYFNTHIDSIFSIKLCLKNNHIDHTNHISNFCKKFKKIHNLNINLSFNNINYERIIPLCDTIKELNVNTLLLSLDANKLTNIGCNYLLDSISNNKFVKNLYLYLNWNQLTDKIEYNIKNISNSKTIEKFTIHLWGNEIEKEVIASITGYFLTKKNIDFTIVL